jgi:hypothetical protein
MQIGPDTCPGRVTQHLPRQLTVRRAFNLQRLGGIHVAPVGEALIEVRLADPGDARQPLPLLEVDGAWDRNADCHTPHGSDSLRQMEGVYSVFTANRYVKMNTALPSEMLESYPMETAGERRRRKLRELCETHGRETVAARSNVNPYALEQVIKGVLLPRKRDGTRSPRNLGDAAARAIEKAFNLPAGWFDAPEGAAGLDPDSLLVAKVYQRMTTAERARLDRLMAAAMDMPMRDTAVPPREHIGGLSGLGDLEEPKQKKKG